MTDLSKNILKIAIPSIIANITTPLLSIIDTAIAGHLASANALAAVALGGSIFTLLYWPFGFLRMGTSGLTSQASGADDTNELSALFYRALSIALIIGLVLIALRPFLSDYLVAFMAGGTESTADAEKYFGILIFGAPASLGIYAVNGWLIGRGKALSAMWLSLFINVCNIVASFLLVYAIRLDISGLAFGTLTAQWLGLIFGILIIVNSGIKKVAFRFIYLTEKLKHFFSLNADLFLRTLCLVAVTLWFTAAGARQGDTTLAANSLLMQLFILFSYIIDGFAYSGETIIGHIVGSGHKENIHIAIKKLFIFGSATALLFTIIYAFAGDLILGILCDKETIIARARDFYLWALTIPFAGFGAFIWDGVFIGHSLSRFMLLSMLSAAAIFFGVYFVLTPLLGNHALWLAFILYLFTRGAIQSAFYFRIRERL